MIEQEWLILSSKDLWRKSDQYFEDVYLKLRLGFEFWKVTKKSWIFFTQQQQNLMF